MTSEDVRAELNKQPFIPFHLHLVSGKTVDVSRVDSAEMLQNAVLVFHAAADRRDDVGYDVVSLRNIERLEQLKNSESDANA